MKAKDLLKIILEYQQHLNEKKLKFIKEISPRVLADKPINPVQHKYLQDCYDLCVARAFGLEETMAPEKEYFIQSAIKKNKGIQNF